MGGRGSCGLGSGLPASAGERESRTGGDAELSWGAWLRAGVSRPERHLTGREGCAGRRGRNGPTWTERASACVGARERGFGPQKGSLGRLVRELGGFG